MNKTDEDRTLTTENLKKCLEKDDPYEELRKIVNELKTKSIPEGTILSISRNNIITIYNKESAPVGEIDFSSTKIMFEGNMHESAEALFTFLKFILDPIYDK